MRAMKRDATSTVLSEGLPAAVLVVDDEDDEGLDPVEERRRGLRLPRMLVRMCSSSRS
jgi:hypothetical protein